MPKLLLTLLSIINILICFAQKNYGVSQDYYIYKNEQGFIVPLVYYETKNDWYASAKYNYEENQTFAFQLGKKFSKEGIFSYSVTPLAGLLAGRFNGFSLGTQVEVEAGKFSLYTEPEYCTRFNNEAENFFYNWSEFSIQFTRFFYIGLALQTIKTKKEPWYAEPGPMLGITIKNFEVPFYFFRTSASSNYFVVGIHWSLN